MKLFNFYIISVVLSLFLSNHIYLVFSFSSFIARVSSTSSSYLKSSVLGDINVDCVVKVDLEDRSYPIYIGHNILDTYSEPLTRHISCKKALIVTNTVVAPLYLETVRAPLEMKGIEVFDVILPDGEEFKTMDSIMTILDKAMDSKLDRKSYMIALGGGVIGDMTGFAAAIYQRGIRFIQIPTTVMAMVDSSVGGKTAVNHIKGKNMIGAFYQPESVVIDTDTLRSLPNREFNSGLAEVVKYGLIRDKDFFVWLEENIDLVMSRQQDAMNEVFRRSCENKAEVVAADEKESELRAILNFGHTFGHAVETGFGYGTWLHGEAVSVGMLMAAEMSCELGWISPSIVSRIRVLLDKCELPTNLMNKYAINDLGVINYNELFNSLTTDRFLELMSYDKKVADGKLSLILLEGNEEVGKCIITNKFNADVLKRVVDKYCNLKVPALC